MRESRPGAPSPVRTDLREGVVHHADGRREALTALEQRLLAFFVKNSGRIISRQELLREVWGVPDRVPTRTLDIAISRLRAKIEPDASNPRYLVTHRGLGYRYEARRRGAPRVRARIETEGGWLDLERRTVRTGGVEYTLGDRETDLLGVLLEHPGESVPAPELLHALWGRGLDTGRVRTALSRLRHKVETDPTDPRHLVTTAAGVAFLPLDTAAPRHSTNLLDAENGFFGRVEALRRATSQVRDGVPVLVRASDGVGKTRFLAELGLREAVAQRVWPGGVWMASVRRCNTSEEVAGVVAEVLGLSLAGPSRAGNLLRVLGALRRWGRSLVLLDDADDAAVAVGAFVARLRAEAPETGIVIASRGRLGLREGYDLSLPTLRPADAERMLIDRLSRAENVQLSGDETVISRIAARLEGLPLSLELAAGQIAAVGDRKLLEALGWARPLAGASPPASSLQGALSAAWSLLSPQQASLLRTVSVWQGSFGLSEARAVAEKGLFVPAILGTLVSANLIRLTPGSAASTPQRFALADAVRVVARRRLQRSGEEEDTLTRQRDWLLQRVEGLARDLDGSHPTEALAQLNLLRGDVLATVARWRRTVPAVAARLQLGLWRATQWSRTTGELTKLLAEAEAAAEESGIARLHARALLVRARAGAAVLSASEGLELAARGRDLARSAGDPALESLGHLLVGVALQRQGRYEACLKTLERASQLLDGLDEHDLSARVWLATAAALRQSGSPAAALAAYRRALTVARLGGCRASLVRAHLRLGWELLALRKWGEAARELGDGLDASADLPWPAEEARILGLLARAALEAGDVDTAERWVDQAIELERRRFPEVGAAQPRNTLALLRVEQGRFREAEEEGLRLGGIMDRYQSSDPAQPLFLRGLARLVGRRPGAAGLFEQLDARANTLSPQDLLDTRLCLAVASSLEGNSERAAGAMSQAEEVFGMHPELAASGRNVRMASAIVSGSAEPALEAEVSSVSSGELGFLGRVFRSLLHAHA